MAYKEGYRVLIIFSFIFLFFSCKKYSEQEQVIEIEAMNPVTLEPIAGIKFTIYEIYYTSSGILNVDEEAIILYEGVTDSMGFAKYKHLPLIGKGGKIVNNSISFDYSETSLVPGDYELLSGYEGLLYYPESGYTKIDIHLVPKLKVIEQIKNLNCYDGNDKIRYKIRYPHLFSGDWLGWIPGPNINGGYLYSCGDSVISVNPSMIQDSVYLEIEVTRNNIVTTIRDSMLLDPSKTQDTVKIYF